MPVRVVVALLRALVAVAVAGGVLPRVNGRVPVSSNLLASLEEAFVPFASSTVLIRLVGFVTSKTVVYVTVAVSALILILGDGVRSCAVANATQHRTRTFAHILHDDIALEVGIIAAVLRSPFNWKLGADVVLERANVDATAAVVLGIEQTICVVSIAVGLVQPVISYFEEEMKMRRQSTCCSSRGDFACIRHKGRVTPRALEGKWRSQSSAC